MVAADKVANDHGKRDDAEITPSESGPGDLSKLVRPECGMRITCWQMLWVGRSVI